MCGDSKCDADNNPEITPETSHGGPFSNDFALEALSERLHFEMERLEPSNESDWCALSDYDKEFYRQCVKAILSRPSYVRRLIE